MNDKRAIAKYDSCKMSRFLVFLGDSGIGAYVLLLFIQRVAAYGLTFV